MQILYVRVNRIHNGRKQHVFLFRVLFVNNRLNISGFDSAKGITACVHKVLVNQLIL